MTMVDIKTKDGRHTLRGWWIPAEIQTNKTIVIAAGLKDSKEEVSQLVLASMLHRSGFNVALVDYLNNGTSDCSTGIFNGGYAESDHI